MATDQDILGRADVNDLEAIIAITNTDVTEAIHTVEDNADAIFTWDYEKGARPALNKLYEKAKHVAVERRDRPRLVDRRRPREDRQRAAGLERGRARSSGSSSTPTRRSRTSATRSGPSSASSR